MNNKTDIEEDIEICKDTIGNFKAATTEITKDIFPRKAEALENMLADRERLIEENTQLTENNFKLTTELENKKKEYQETYKDVREEIKELQAKANAYDGLVEKIKQKIELYKKLEIESYDRDSIQADEYRAIIKNLQELLDTEKEKR